MSEPTTLSSAMELLDEVAKRAAELRNDLRDGLAADGKSLDQDSTIAVHAAALAAVANLSPENLQSLELAIRQRKLPRRKGA